MYVDITKVLLLEFPELWNEIWVIILKSNSPPFFLSVSHTHTCIHMYVFVCMHVQMMQVSYFLEVDATPKDHFRMNYVNISRSGTIPLDKSGKQTLDV